MADIPGELVEAFWAYERALAADDVDALDRWFLPDPSTLRADAQAVLTGHQAVADFRRERGGAPPRVIERLHLRPVADGCVVALAEARRTDGSRGIQTQVWVRAPEGWRIAAAHVSGHASAPGAAPPGSDAAGVWRVVGSPLVRGAAGALDGTRVAVKDLFAVAGRRIGAGNPDWLSEAPVEQANAHAVQILLDAGADVTGIAQTDELAFSLSGTNKHYGTPPNPAAPGRVPGGSSSGPASAVALDLADLGLGTDTGGSVRVPSSHCGLYGIRTTHGAVPTDGVVPLAPSFDTVGWISRDAGLLARAGAVLLPPDDPEPVTNLLVAEDVAGLAEPETRLSFTAACTALSGRMGLPLKRLDALCEGRLEEWFAAFRAVQAAEAWACHGAWISAHPGSLGPGIAARFAAGRDIGADDRASAEKVLDEGRQALREALPPGTALLLPAACGPAPAVGAPPEAMDAYRAATLRLTCLASLAGLPAVVMPLLSVRGLPTGLCAVGSRGADRALLRFAVESSTIGERL